VSDRAPDGSSATQRTVLMCPDDVLIADGNKTAVAAYVYALETQDPAFQLAVHYIDVLDRVINWII
jgi:hypothetical protein